ncbi:MAG: hypothetical protein H6662_17750 [Ardenticatenaceae bacterium]|nr:hypothetical protein [Anaerolineales bacterium]MCB8923433.1 hypothetical protein [Ardenticatenaceae bacterium]MCB8991412.1 hypothetical protein [Ardenticatenaceae bacterium]MCB9003842.1 hypothetical protein [Ardenticatenaceae bacterium]
MVYVDKQSSASVQAEVQALRQCLRRCGSWPEAADHFVALMPGGHWHAPKPNDDDFQLLPQVVKDATDGKDIGAQYPAFLQKLFAHTTLRQAFIEAMLKVGE